MLETEGRWKATMYGEMFFTVLGKVYLETVSAYRNDWRRQPIVEIGEPLIKVDSRLCYPYYRREMGIGDEKIFLRAETLKRLLKARRFLNDFGFDLVVYDGWRSIKLQENLFWLYMKKFTAKRFRLAEYFANAEDPPAIKDLFLRLDCDLQQKMVAENRRYVSLPSIDLS